MSFMHFPVACMGWYQVLRSNPGSLGLSGLTKWSILNRLGGRLSWLALERLEAGSGTSA